MQYCTIVAQIRLTSLQSALPSFLYCPTKVLALVREGSLRKMMIAWVSQDIYRILKNKRYHFDKSIVPRGFR
jgi:hypothetical protein